MKAKIFSISIFALLLYCTTLKAQFGGGDGTTFNPYLIATPTHLNNIKLTDDDGVYLYLDAHFLQTANIDLDVAPYNAGEGWEPIGTADHPFTGYYHGYDHSIYNLFINRQYESNIGLFGVTNGAEIYDVKLVDVSIEGSENTGALVGSFLGNSRINEADDAHGMEIQTFSSGSVFGNHQGGGLIGYADSSLVRRSHSTCTVEGFDFIGGLVGKSDKTDIVLCYASSTVIGNNDKVGGLVGRAYESGISECYADCDVDMTGLGLQTGGLVGYLYSNSTVENCYSTGTVDGEGTIGGLTGYNNGSTITNCYSRCIVTGSGAYVGGLAGRNSGTINNSYWDTEVSGIAEPGPGEGRTTDEMTYPYSEDTFVDWHFAFIWIEDPEIGFGQFNNGYPYLEWQHNPQQFGFAGGDGTEADPYQISHPAHLNSVRACIHDFFIQTDDIDLGEAPWNEGTGWDPIGDGGGENSFRGHYDGANYQISNLTINNAADDNLGLFGSVSSATLTNVRLTDVNITGNDKLGGLIGHSANTDISNCFVSGVINGDDKLGGLIGEIDNSATSNITGCETDVSISGETNVGGLAGQTTDANISTCKTNGSLETSSNYIGGLTAYAISSQISDCSTTIDVTGHNYTGGLIGIQDNSTVNGCFSTGSISGSQNTGGLIGYNWNNCTVSNSYARSEVSGNSSYLAGFAGYNRPGNTIENCYSTGTVNGLTVSQGFIGRGGGTVINCYWDTETSGDSGSTGGGEGRTTEEMKNLTGFTDETTPDLTEAWDFVGNPIDDTADDDNWDIDGTLNDGYPFISFQKARINWDGSENSDPETAENWNTETVPGPTDNILILSTAANNLVVDNLPSSPLTFNSIFLQTGSAVEVNPGKAFTISGYVHNEGGLELKCDETGSASFLDLYPETDINFSGDGEAEVELFLQENQWHYVSSPVNDATANVFFNIYLKQFDEEDSSWVFIVSPDSILNPMRGYAAWASAELTGSTTVSFTGKPNTGGFSSTLTNHGDAGHNSIGFNFVGNPYPSAIDWQKGASAWTRTNIDPTVYLWNPSVGQYGVYNRTNKLGTNGVDSIIPPKQGFFVHVAESGTGTLAVNNNARLHHDKGFFKSGNISGFNSLLKLTVNGNGYSDETIINFNENTGFGFDSNYDAYKIKGLRESPQLYTHINQVDYAINTLGKITENLSVQMYFESGVPAIYTISAENTGSFEPETDIWLEDKLESRFQNLRVNPTYSFSSQSDDGPDRFVIHFFEPDLGCAENEGTNSILIFSDQNDILINIPEGDKGKAQIYDITGRIIRTVELTQMQTRITGLNRAFYLLSVHTSKNSKTMKISL